MRHTIQAPPFMPPRGFPWLPGMPPGPGSPPSPGGQMPFAPGGQLPSALLQGWPGGQVMPGPGAWIPQGAAPPAGMPQLPGGWPSVVGPATPAQSSASQGWAVGREEFR